MMVKKALVGMSGGVDSSVAAYLVREAGYDVTGATMRLYDNETIGLDSKTCCSLASIEDACAVANRLGISYVVYDMRDEFRREVIDNFVSSYERGETPNPCYVCNNTLKFDAMYRLGARDLLSVHEDGSRSDTSDQSAARSGSSGADGSGMSCGNIVAESSECVKSPDADCPLYVVTGHYAVIEYDVAGGRWLLRKGADPGKDQSYFLAGLTQEQLSRTLFPLGNMTKPEVRDIADSLGLATAKKRESQDICFVPGGDYAGFIRGYTGRNYPEGDFVDAQGRVMGRHRGIIGYTVGQRKGLGLALKKPAYVLGLDTENNRVILGDNEDLFTRRFTAREFNWVSMAEPSGDIRAAARIRYRHKEASARIIPEGHGRVTIEFDEPQRAITRGQTVVVYDGDYVIGGGIIG